MSLSVAAAVREMNDEAIGALVSELSPEAIAGMIRQIPDAGLILLIQALPEGSNARKGVLLTLGAAMLKGTPEVAEAPVKRGRGRPRKYESSEPRAAPKAPTSGRKLGEKRSPKDLAALVEKLYLYIKAHPGQRIEPIGKALGVVTKELTLPIKKLLVEKKISAIGQKRATEYSLFPPPSVR